MAARKAAKRGGESGFRLGLLGCLLILSWIGLGYRLVEVQVVRADEFSDMGLDQRLTRRVLPPDRGTVFDRNGDPLAMTIEALSIYAVPGEVTNPVYVSQQVSAITGKDWEAIEASIARGGQFAYLVRQVEPAVAQKILDLELPGVYSIPEPKRVYPAGPVASHLTGLVNVDGVGIEGLELVYDDVLTGVPGELVFERDISGRPIPQAYREVIPAVPGHDLIITADLSLQYAAYDTCLKTVEETGAKGCWAVVLEVETGEVLAMAGTPGFDPESRTGTDGSTIFSNFAVRGMYEPGSTQKLITFATALDTGTFDVNDVIGQVADRIEITPGACKSPDDDLYGCFGDFSAHETRDMTVREIFTVSSNVGTIKMAQHLPDGKLAEYMKLFGFGTSTGLDYSGEAPGLIDRALDRTCSSCLASASIGYAVAVTPLQIAAAYAAIANDGVWVQPHLVSTRMDASGNSISVEPDSHRVVSQETAWVMRQLLGGVVNEGTGQAAAISGYSVGGKTGTANKLGDDGKYTEETIASFVGMAPIDDPKIVVAVVVDDPDYAHRTGGLAAAPAFSEIMEAALHSLGVTPDATLR